MIKNLPQLVPQEVCLSCDGCCRFAEADSPWCPKMAREEIDKQGVSSGALLEKLGENNRIKAVEYQGQIQCAFFHVGRNTCQVYECRPFECRWYPFLLMRKGDDVAVGVHLSCPYIQEKWKDTDFKNHVESLRRYFQQQEVLAFVRRNQALFDNYSGCEQEVERLFELPL